ncbi:membrane-bound lytic murein transglycosylase A [Mesorhizobium albiziae]|uniref:peptidoglycan lytic exotransglycosylase n=1 Tax=Neomesorhizobium albiziae TaxID=335020 RepID=A0A1I3Y5F2_9HYPH|nr:murein transglycosylase A [Mesorhizobium albiziae]SFK27002.1 membrane-bound lytic murein transglycosylase A [Mesorhizobium albiziae]
MALSQYLREVRWSELPGWPDDAPAEAFEAFRRSAFHVLGKPYRSGALGVDFSAFSEAYEGARAAGSGTAAQPDARRFFERHFVPCKVVPDNGGKKGFVTGFYEPEAEASPVQTGRFQYPLLRRPSDLVDIDDTNRPAGMDPYLAFGRQTAGGIVEYFDRASIEQGALAGRNLEIAWLADPVDAFFIHVQGAARLAMSDGTSKRVTYAAKSGHRFSGPGRKLADLGEIPENAVTMQSIRTWFRDNPARISEILWQNRSFIFFRETPVEDTGLGPVAAAKVPLTPGRSIAVDRLLHTFGTPFFIDAPTLTAFDEKPFRRLMIAQDTGSAITGTARGDLFTGSGFAAGEVAGVIKHAADFYELVPKKLVAGSR